MHASDPDPAIVASALQQHRVLGQLDANVRLALLGAMKPARFEAGEVVAGGEDLAQPFGLLCAGEMRMRNAEGNVTLELKAPDWFGAGVHPARSGQDLEWIAVGPVEVAFLPRVELLALCDDHPVLRWFLDASSVEHPATDPHGDLMRSPVKALLKRPPVSVSPDASIRNAAQLMQAERVSSVLVVDQGRLRGLVTDRDLRNRVLAAGIDPATPVSEIATAEPFTMAVESPGFEALLLMARHNIHHVPLTDGDRVVGMITATDITESQSSSPVLLAGDIHKQTTVEGLVACAGRVKTLQQQLAAANASAYSTGRIVTAISDALTTRLLRLGEDRFGPPPVPYAWVAAGSQARNEQTAKSDQDNCMVLDDSYDPVAHGAYFKSLSTWVCDGLNACGYVYCPGEMMAMTDRWRQPQQVWAEYFRQWIDKPEPMALMLTCVFFDVRVVSGQVDLLERLRSEVLRQTPKAGLFLALMVGNALKHAPPLGLFSLFGGLSTIRSGEHKGTIDLKHSGIVPIIDLARVYALAAGHPAVNTYERLDHAAQSGEISPQGVRDLREALEFLASLRIRHQSQRMAEGFAADNYLRPETLSNFERGQLKDAFGVVKSLQDVLAQRYPLNR